MHGQHVPLGSLGDIFTAHSLRCGVRCRSITVEAGAGGIGWFWYLVAGKTVRYLW